MSSIIRLPRTLQLRLESTSRILLQPSGGRAIDFTRPRGEFALALPDSVSWRIFKNPIALLVGGIAAVILELAEPAVRTGVWEHSSFHQDPMGRLRRTGLAAMVTVYGARSLAEPMIANIVRMHGRIHGKTPRGESFCANDTALLDWVHATASFGFSHAYDRYVAPLAASDFDALYAEGSVASRLYGACGAPTSSAQLEALFAGMRRRLEASPIVFEFLNIMRVTPAFPTALRWLQPLLVRAAIALIPAWIRDRLGLEPALGLSRRQRLLVQLAGIFSDRIVLPDAPPAQACERLGLPVHHLYG